MHDLRTKYTLADLVEFHQALDLLESLDRKLAQKAQAQ